MSSNRPAKITEEASGRTQRQEGTYNRLLDAAVELLREVSYSELTVGGVAARAQVSRATAYKYVNSKNELLAEVYLRRIRTVPMFVDVNQTTHQRITQELHELAMQVAHEPNVAAAITTALMGDEEELHPLRDKIGGEVRRRITAALGPAIPPNVVEAVEFVFYGGLVRAGTGTLTYRTISKRLDGVLELILRSVDEP